jgi:hypothetical protein
MAKRREAEYRGGTQPRRNGWTYKRAKERVAAPRGFYIQTLVYLVVDLGLAINMLASPNSLCCHSPLIGPGIGLTSPSTPLLFSPASSSEVPGRNAKYASSSRRSAGQTDL